MEKIEVGFTQPPETSEGKPKVRLDDRRIVPASNSDQSQPGEQSHTRDAIMAPCASQDGNTPPNEPEGSNITEESLLPGHYRFGGTSKHGVSDLPEGVRGADDTARFEDEEEDVKKKAEHNIFWRAIVNGYSALMVFAVHLISLESLLSIALSVALTIYVYNETEDNPSFDGTTLDWVLLSFAVITPMSASIGMSFGRRERALAHLVAIRSTMLHLYSAHSAWDWKKTGKPDSGREGCKDVNWQEHADAALVEILGICHGLSRFLTLPNATRARHRITKQGTEEAKETMSLASKLYGCMLVRFGRLTNLCEVLKSEGLPPNEATRIRQWERMVMEHVDGLRMIKIYRTPQALRSFARLFTVFLPPFYAPSYAEIGRSIGSIAVGIAFSVLTSLALTALFETISQMEDPFLGQNSLDGVDVESELSSAFAVQALTMRSHFFHDAEPFDEHCVAASACVKLPVQEFIFVNTELPGGTMKFRKRH